MMGGFSYIDFSPPPIGGLQVVAIVNLPPFLMKPQKAEKPLR